MNPETSIQLVIANKEWGYDIEIFEMSVFDGLVKSHLRTTLNILG